MTCTLCLCTFFVPEPLQATTTTVAGAAYGTLAYLDAPGIGVRNGLGKRLGDEPACAALRDSEYDSLAL